MKEKPPRQENKPLLYQKKKETKKNQQFSRGNTNKPKSVSAKKAHQDILRDFESIAWLVNIETLLANTHNLVVKDV